MFDKDDFIPTIKKIISYYGMGIEIRTEEEVKAYALYFLKSGKNVHFQRK